MLDSTRARLLLPADVIAGQKQVLVCLARALILQPSIIVADEALNGLGHGDAFSDHQPVLR